MNCLFKGSAVALVTPMKNNNVDFVALEKLLRMQLEAKTDAVVVLGTTGEPSTLSRTEKNDIITFSKGVLEDRCKLIVGTGGNNTREVIHDSLIAKTLGADGLLIVTPYYNKATDKGLLLHYDTIARCVDMPIILYNVPSRTGVNLKPEVVEKLAKIENIVGIKEASGNISQILKLFHLVGNKLPIYCGEDQLNYLFFTLGASGVISAVANVAPKHIKKICDLSLNGNFVQALKLQNKMYDLNNSLFLEVNPIPVKTALNLNGVIQEEFRLPLCEMGEKNKNILKKQVSKFSNFENNLQL